MLRELKIGFEIMLKTNYQRITEIIFFLLLTATTAEAQPNIESEFKTLPKAGDVNFNSPTSEEIRRKRISSVMTVVNNYLLSGDTDSDGIPNENDNCPLIANNDQSNIDDDKFGDACDSDTDGDGTDNAADNCPLIANADQANADGDAFGDACDSDTDGDGTDNASDNCPLIANADQANADGDAFGDACDSDTDGDGTDNSTDNCPLIANANQFDTDADGTGNACSLTFTENTDEITLELNDFISDSYSFDDQFQVVFADVGADVELCFMLDGYTAIDDTGLTRSLNSLTELSLTDGENCFTVPAANQISENQLTFLVENSAASLSISGLSLTPVAKTNLGLQSTNRSGWGEREVRKVLKIFAFGGHATDAQIDLWSNMLPEAAITEMLNFDEHNLKLSPLIPGEKYGDHATQYGTLLAFSDDYMASGSTTNLPMPLPLRAIYGTIRDRASASFIRMATVRGLNPFRQRIGFWETNYHLAVNLDTSVNSYQVAGFYDAIMEAHESGVPYQKVLAAAAKSAATAEQYLTRLNRWINDTCFCNDDFAREIHQLYFGIFGVDDPDHHENVTIKNTAKMLTHIFPQKAADPARAGRGNVVQFGTTFHHIEPLEILGATITGATASEKIDNLLDVSIEHPESLQNLPIIIIEGLADHNLTDSKKTKLRSAWASMGNNKNFLTFIRAYAISDLFHDTMHEKYLTSVERVIYMANRYNIDNIEALYGALGKNVGRPIEPQLRDDVIQIFRPSHNVFGGQTPTEAANAPHIFEKNYNRMTFYSAQFFNYVSCSDCDDGQSWQKDWSKLIPKSAGEYRADDVVEWLWNHIIGNMDNYTDLERAYLVSILGGVNNDPTHPLYQSYQYDLAFLLCIRNDRILKGQPVNSLNELISSTAYCRHADDGEADYTDDEKSWLNTIYTSDMIANTPHIAALVDEMGQQIIPLQDADSNVRLRVNRRIQFVIAHIMATPFIFSEGG